MQFGQKNACLFSIVMPALAVLVSMTLLILPACQNYLNLRRSAHQFSQREGRSSNLLVGSGNFQMVLPVEEIPKFAFNTAAMRVQGIITFLNAPGYLVYGLSAGATGHSARWSPDGIWSGLWLAIMMPLCTVPAWWFVGRGMDGFFKRRRLRLGDMIASVLLLLGSATISAGLRFGLTAEELKGGDISAWFIPGYAWWAALFAIPFGIWIYQRTRAFKER